MTISTFVCAVSACKMIRKWYKICSSVIFQAYVCCLFAERRKRFKLMCKYAQLMKGGGFWIKAFFKILKLNLYSVPHCSVQIHQLKAFFFNHLVGFFLQNQIYSPQLAQVEKWSFLKKKNIIDYAHRSMHIFQHAFDVLITLGNFL